MQDSECKQIVAGYGKRSDEDGEAEKCSEDGADGDNSDDAPVIDISGKAWEVALLDHSKDTSKELYLYRNVFTLIPQSLGELRRLKTLKFFANEINLFPSETGNLVDLECLQVKVSSPSLSGLSLHKLKALKNLELCKIPPRPSAFPILSDIASLTSLTKLSVCYFSIRYLPPEIGCLAKLEFLDLSFNKLKKLPIEVTSLTSLKSLKVAHNKLDEIPSTLSSLQRLESLDLSYNRLASLGSLNLAVMHTLQKLNLQFNKLLDCCQIPSWICCNLEGNGKDTSNDEFISSSVEVDLLDASFQKIKDLPCTSSPNISLSALSDASSITRCSTARRMRKGWKRRDHLQQRARQECLNNSRKWKTKDHDDIMTINMATKCAPFASESLVQTSATEIDEDNIDKLSEQPNPHIMLTRVDEKIGLSKGQSTKSCPCISFDPIDICKECNHENQGQTTSSVGSLDRIDEQNTSSVGSPDGIDEQDEDSSSEASKNNPKSKRHSDRDLDNPKASKSRRPTSDTSNLSCKYSTESFCSINDRLPDGFYDAGRGRPFMSLECYESLCHDSREVILVDRERDEELDAIALSAQALVSGLKQLRGSVQERERFTVGNLQVASVLALYVSSCFGGSDRDAIVERTRKAVAGSNYQKPFVCTCATGNHDGDKKSTKKILGSESDFIELSEKSLRSIKEARGSNIVPIGTLRFGVCRHRAVLMKYLCDRVEPPIPCELVRGFLDFMPHAWNTILLRRGDSFVRMVVDACNPTDIREETDPEYFCRYIPLSRILVPVMTENMVSSIYSFPSLSLCDEIEKAASSSLVRCKVGSVEAAAKVRFKFVHSMEEMKRFEYTCLGEVRMLGALKKHSCVVEIYGHQISSKWLTPLEGNKEGRLLQSAIVMEYIQGGSLKSYLESLTRDGCKHVPVDLALFIARDVACALAELHIKHIIHRDIKSENILIDLDKKRADGTPTVKLCDFDRAVPLRSFLHTCCIAHVGIPAPDMCVGTPRWMAPEVLQTMHNQKKYGLEVDIWSYGCLLLELLTLQVPYAGLPESEIHRLLQMGERPLLTEELEILRFSEEPERTRSSRVERVDAEAEAEIIRFLVDLFRRCTKGNPADRPTAEQLYDMLQAHANSFLSSRSYELEAVWL
ncbi:uncharacterized protein LOC122069186 [Macadamia integrifolia]|uniref:uncharacterized protein LOC122069186 n=1 Tax=Macadamia integrifolia TaxID=60698 RepID=UPI001C4F4B28|nr:uncharacterized protein LOC122069186 [Macadamia integrifolia]XP_042489074.1 uncharacterized protein LOC122069186 [Macadamia integrifolia]